MEKVWIVLQESNVDGEILINVVPCESLEVAKKVLSDEKELILNDSYHFGKINNTDVDIAEFEIEESDTSFYINDPCDDYYEDIKILEKEVIVKMG